MASLTIDPYGSYSVKEGELGSIEYYIRIIYVYIYNVIIL